MLTIPLSSSNKIPLYEQIYQYIKKLILSGELSGGTKLPSPRSLAAECGVSRNTVNLAFELLQSEGYVDSQQRKGFYVNELNHIQRFSFANNQVQPSQVRMNESNYNYDFSPDLVDLSHFPYRTWRHLMNECIQSPQCFVASPSQGDEHFRQTVATYVHDSRNVACTADQIVIGAGVDYLLWLLSMILGKNTSLAMENPGYERCRAIFQNAGNPIIDIPVNKHGLDVNALRSTQAEVCYVTPSHQYPLGSIMPINERLNLLSWADESEHRYIIEDDHDSEFRYIGHPIPSLQGTKNKDNVIYLGTFSKAITPSIRVGYMVLPRPLLAKYTQFFSVFPCTVSRLDQYLLDLFLSEGHFEKHINRMRKIYKQKHDLMLSLIKQYPVTICGENSGLSFAIFPQLSTNKKDQQVNGPQIEMALIEQARALGIHITGLAKYYHTLPTPYTPGFLIGFGALTIEQINTGIPLLFNQVFNLS